MGFLVDDTLERVGIDAFKASQMSDLLSEVRLMRGNSVFLNRLLEDNSDSITAIDRMRGRDRH